MLRARSALLTAALGLGLFSGCSSTGSSSNEGWFHRLTHRQSSDPCQGTLVGMPTMTEGPMLQDYGPYPVGSAAPSCGVMPQTTMPPLAPPGGRIEAQPEPYRPVIREIR